MRHASAMLIAVLGILGACGSEPNGPLDSKRLVVTVTGTVRSAHNATPIPGASLELYRISNYTIVTLDRDTTDPDGLYRLSTTYLGNNNCDEPGVFVGASGYYDGYFVTPAHAQCVEGPQTIDIYLDPEPLRLIVSPKTQTLRRGERQRFEVSATFADGTSGAPPPYGPWPPPYGGDWHVVWRVAGDSTCGWIVGPETGASVEYVAPATASNTLCGTTAVGQVVVVAGVVILGQFGPPNDSAIVTISP